MCSVNRILLTACLFWGGTVLVEAADGASAWLPGEAEWPTAREVFEVITLHNYNTRLVVLSTALLGITSGLVGTFLLLRKRSLMGDALSHATLPGIGIAFLVMASLGGNAKNLPGLLAGATLSGLVGMLFVLAIDRTTRLRQDASMGCVLSVFFGLGVAILGMVQSLPQASAAGLESFIYGKTASMVRQDFLLICSITGLVAFVTLLLLKEFTLLCFDANFTQAEGFSPLVLDLLMLGLVTAVTVIGLQAVGMILIIAFLITPAAAARFWTHRLPLMLILAALIGGASGWMGGSLSALLPRLPAGAVIVLVAAFLFLVSMLMAPARGVLPRLARQAHLRRKVGRQHLLRAVYEILESRRPRNTQAVVNLPIPVSDLLQHRSWSPTRLRRLLRTARHEDHVESSSQPELVRLSESGFGEAARITRNHRLWEMFLIRHADIAPTHVDRDADMVEHVLGADMVRQLEIELESRASQADMPASPHPINQSSS